MKYLNVAYAVAFSSIVVNYGYLAFASLSNISVSDTDVLVLMLSPAIQMLACMCADLYMNRT